MEQSNNEYIGDEGEFGESEETNPDELEYQERVRLMKKLASDLRSFLEEYSISLNDQEEKAITTLSRGSFFSSDSPFPVILSIIGKLPEEKQKVFFDSLHNIRTNYN